MGTTGFQIIRKASPAIKQICGTQQFRPDDNYKLSTFVIKTAVSTGDLLFSTVTGEVLLVTNHALAKDYLVKNWFLIHPNLNEKEFVFKVKKLMKAVRNLMQKGFETFEIVTTTLCNARCFYCYEENFTRMSMSAQIAEKVIEFIMRYKKRDPIRLKWYGGEPLMNVKIINQISSALNQNGIDFYSTMISNGLLFNNSVVQTAKKLWHLRSVMITIDGTEETYNKTKNFISEPQNAYIKVLSNIDNLIQNGVHVIIRLNIERQNLENNSSLIEELCLSYCGCKYIKFMIRPLNNTEANRGIESSEDERAKILEAITDFRDRIYNAGFDIDCGPLSGITGCNCIADNQKYILIKPNGDLAYCSIDFETKRFGSVLERLSKIEYPDLEKSIIEKDPICDDCPIFPQCTPNSICPSCVKTFCTMQQREFNILEQKLKMKMLYRKRL